MKSIFKLIAKLVGMLITLYLVLGALFAVTLGLYDDYSNQYRALYQQPVERANSYESWSAATHQAIGESEKYDELRGLFQWFTYPGMRFQFNTFETDMRRTRDDYAALLGQLDSTFSGNALLKRSWEQMVLTRAAEPQLTMNELGDSVKRLFNTPRETSRVLTDYINFHERPRTLQVRLMQMRQALIAEATTLFPIDPVQRTL